jgi:hypothetical protein
MLFKDAITKENLLKYYVKYETNNACNTRKKLRSTYNRLKRNLPWLFNWCDYFELKMPHTFNAIVGHFSDLKKKLR